MPKDQAMDFVLAEYNRGLAKERPPRDPADIAAEASQLLDDFLDREKIARHTVPSETRQLLVLLGDGVHLYPEELETISEYVRSRQDHVQGETITQQFLQKRCFSFDFLYQLCFVLRSYISVSPAFYLFSFQQWGWERDHVTSRVGETTSSASDSIWATTASACIFNRGAHGRPRLTFTCTPLAFTRFGFSLFVSF